MSFNPRHQQLVKIAREKGYVTVDELVERLDVTPQTVRRDINTLCDMGVLSRFHGGAAFRSSVANMPYETRRDTMAGEKARIAAAAVAAIPDHSSIFIDIGTTAEAFADQLMEKSGLTIVTNNINVINMLRTKEDFELVICGGTVRGRDLAVAGQATTEFLSRFQVDYAMLGVVSIARDGSILDFSVDEGPLTQAIIACGRNVFVLADRSKFGRQAMARVGHISQVTALFADALPDRDWREHFETLGPTIHLVGNET